MNDEEQRIEEVKKAVILLDKCAKTNNISPYILAEAGSNLAFNLCLKNNVSVEDMAHGFAIQLANYKLALEAKNE